MPEKRDELLQRARGARDSAARARRIARMIPTPSASATLDLYAQELDEEADDLERRAQVIDAATPDQPGAGPA
jgi:hypothetical protein